MKLCCALRSVYLFSLLSHEKKDSLFKQKKYHRFLHKTMKYTFKVQGLFIRTGGINIVQDSAKFQMNGLLSGGFPQSSMTS